MYKLLTLNKISEIGLKTLTDNYTYSDNEKNPDGILLRSYKMHDMELPESLLAVARCGAGVNNIPLDKCADKGIVVFNTPGANANAVKELVISALLLASRDITGGYNWAQTLTEDVAAKVEKGKAQFAGPEIMGKRLGVIGLGAIGVLVANAAKALGMDVLGYDPYLSVKSAWSISSGVKNVSLDELLAQSDYITIHVPYMPATKGMLGADAFKKVKKGVRIINLARGELVDNAAIKSAIAEGIVSRYVTDFPNDEVVGVESIITLPHLGASTPEAEDNCAVMAAHEIMDYLENGNITHSVNYPDVTFSADGTKITVLSRDNDASAVMKAISSFTKITDYVSKTKGNYSYGIFAVNGDVEKAAEAVSTVEGVIKVRTIK